MPFVWVAIGSAMGGMARYGCNVFAARMFDTEFPWATLLVNVAGSILIGWFTRFTTPSLRLFLMTGICGGFTTFSAFSLETFNLARGGEWIRAAMNAIASLALCLGGVWLGQMIGRSKV